MPLVLIERDGACARLKLVELLPFDTVPQPEANAVRMLIAIKQTFKRFQEHSNSACIRIAVLSIHLHWKIAAKHSNGDFMNYHVEYILVRRRVLGRAAEQTVTWTLVQERII